MRSLLLQASLLLLVVVPGCRAPAIPAQATAREYAVWHDVLRTESAATPLQQLRVTPETLPLDEAQLQYQRCLPQHMRTIFDNAPAVTLSRNVPEDWLRLPDGSLADLADHFAAPAGGITLQLRLSRVAFSRFHRDGYVWVEHRVCTVGSDSTHCSDREGKLLRITPKGDDWAVEQTNCGAMALGESASN